MEMAMEMEMEMVMAMECGRCLRISYDTVSLKSIIEPNHNLLNMEMVLVS